MSVYASGNVAQQQQRQQHQQRLGELLEAVKQEFDFALNEASNFKQVKEDYDLKYNQQTAEMQQIRQTVFELEMAHRKIKEAYEEEILRLKTELENRDRQQIPGKANGAPFSYIGHQGNQHLPLPAPLKKEGKKDKDTHTGVTTETSIPPVSAVANSMPATLQKAPDTSTGIPVIDKTQYVVDPLQKALHIKEIPPFLCDLDVNKAHPDFKKQKPEYYVLFNPAFSRELDVELVHSLDHSSVVCCVRFSKNGEFIATGCNKTTQVFNVATGELVAKLVDDNTSGHEENGENDANDSTVQSTNSNGDLYIRSVCFSPDGKLLATGTEDKLIRIWDLTTKRIIKILRGHEQDIYSLDFFPDGNRLVSGSGDRTVRIWDLRSSQCSLTLSIEDGVTTVAVSPDGQLIAAGSLDHTVRVWDSTTGFLVERLDSGIENGNGHKDSVYSVVFSNDGKQIASGALDRTIKLWNLEGKQEMNSPGGKRTTCEVTYVGHKDFVLSVCSTLNNEFILSGSKDRGVVFWDQLSGNPLLMLQGHRNSVISVAVSLNSNGTEGIFATGSGDCKARIWKWTRKQ
ncbi:general transcription repressor [Naganishia cerealis]|uniref:General transcription repressor n=1 Tax=Naganishia cerealis TaxID=610337 RepID=A0ACC2V6B9_9TREE|nr:general transcription repressor [Naganishia cerealis]